MSEKRQSKRGKRMFLFALMASMLVSGAETATATATASAEQAESAAKLTFGGKALADVKQVAMGYGVTLALKNDGTVWNWGHTMNGRLSTTAVQIPELSDAASIALAADYGNAVAAVKKDGTVWMLERSSLLAPKKIEGLDGVEAVQISREFSLALKKDGTVWAWGSNAYGELGDGNDEFPRRACAGQGAS